MAARLAGTGEASPLVIRTMTAADLDSVGTIERAAFADPWPVRAFAGLLEQPHARLDVAVAGDPPVPIGYCVLLHVADEAEVANLATSPAHRRRGVGDRLLRHVLARGDAQGVGATFLEVRESNRAARALYAAHGFLEVGRRPRYYRRPDEDALLLRRDRPAPRHSG